MTIYDYKGQYRTIQDYTGLYMIMKDYTGLYRTIWDKKGLYRTKGWVKKNSLNLCNSFCLISPAKNIWKVKSIALSEMQNFSVRYQRAELYAIQYWVSDFNNLINLISLNLIPLRFIHIFFSYEHFRRLGNVPF